MSAIASISINDGATTPVTHVFNPRSTNPAVYRNGNSVGSASGLQFDETIMVDVNINPRGMSKVKITLITPHPANAATGVPEFYESAKVEFLLPQYSSTQNREDIRVLLANLLQNAQIVDAVDNLAYPY